MENFLFIQEVIEKDVLFYLCDFSFNQKLQQDFLLSSPSDGDDLLSPDVSEDIDLNYDSYIIMSYDWQSYIDGILDNIGDCHYISYAHQNGSTIIYTLIYDLKIDESGFIIPGTYNKIDFIEDSNGITSTSSTISDVFIPSPCYSSFGFGSDLRDGFSHITTYTLLFAVVFSIIFSVCSGFFNFILNLGRR